MNLEFDDEQSLIQATAREFTRKGLEPFLAAGDDAFVFFRHDEVGRGAEQALDLQAPAGRGGA